MFVKYRLELWCAVNFEIRNQKELKRKKIMLTTNIFFKACLARMKFQACQAFCKINQLKAICCNTSNRKSNVNA